MAGRTKKVYESCATTSSIRATARVALKVRDSYLTVEASEERTITDPENANIGKEWELLWDSINELVDGQANDIFDAYETGMQITRNNR